MKSKFPRGCTLDYFTETTCFGEPQLDLVVARTKPLNLPFDLSIKQMIRTSSNIAFVTDDPNRVIEMAKYELCDATKEHPRDVALALST